MARQALCVMFVFAGNSWGKYFKVTWRQDQVSWPFDTGHQPWNSESDSILPLNGPPGQKLPEYFGSRCLGQILSCSILRAVEVWAPWSRFARFEHMRLISCLDAVLIDSTINCRYLWFSIYIRVFCCFSFKSIDSFYFFSRVHDAKRFDFLPE